MIVAVDIRNIDFNTLLEAQKLAAKKASFEFVTEVHIFKLVETIK